MAKGSANFDPMCSENRRFRTIGHFDRSMKFSPLIRSRSFRMRGYGEYMGDKKRIDRIETKDLEARGMEVAAFAGSTIRILTIYAIYAIVVSTSNGQLRRVFKLIL